MMKSPDPTLTKPFPGDYASLVASFPPRVIRSRKCYEETRRLISELKQSVRRLNRDQKEYLTLLEILVQRYEGPRQSPGPLVLLRQLVEEHKLRKADLSRILGRSLSLGSMILSGQRKITPEHAARLGRYFGKGPDLFLA